MLYYNVYYHRMFFIDNYNETFVDSPEQIYIVV